MNRDGTSSELDRDREDAEDRHQRFVQQVAEALKLSVVLAHRMGDPLTTTERLIDAMAKLAPRVAAAIHAAITKVNGCHCCADEMGWDEPQKAALHALRGPRADGTP